jgi:hypothetical protein
LGISGALTLVVTVLVLVAVIIVAVMRGRAFDDAAGRKHKERAHLKTHVGFNRYVS